MTLVALKFVPRLLKYVDLPGVAHVYVQVHNVFPHICDISATKYRVLHVDHFYFEIVDRFSSVPCRLQVHFSSGGRCDFEYPMNFCIYYSFPYISI